MQRLRYRVSKIVRLIHSFLEQIVIIQTNEIMYLKIKKIHIIISLNQRCWINNFSFLMNNYTLLSKFNHISDKQKFSNQKDSEKITKMKNMNTYLLMKIYAKILTYD